MKISKVVRYQTSDGREHDTAHNAKTHEAKIAAVGELYTLLTSSLKTGRPEAILQHVVMEAEMVATILTRFRKRLPRNNNG